MRKLALIVLAGAFALSACNSKPPEEPQTTNNVMEVPEEEIPANEAETPVEVPNNSAPAVAPPVVSQDQQTLDDADATGLTARLPDDSVGVPTNQTRQTD